MEEEEQDSSRFSSFWYAIHVKPRTEKKVIEWLAHYRCWRHLPLYVKVRKVQRRKVRRYLPLFPGYVFARLPWEKRRLMLQTNLLVRTIPIRDAKLTIHQLRQISRVSKKAGPEMKKLAQTFKAGEYVRVKFGPFMGTEGYVKREGAQTTLVLNVEILGSSVEVLVLPDNLERIDPASA
jgi:transcription antitermination factor NusG